MVKNFTREKYSGYRIEIVKRPDGRYSTQIFDSKGRLSVQYESRTKKEARIDAKMWIKECRGDE